MFLSTIFHKKRQTILLADFIFQNYFDTDVCIYRIMSNFNFFWDKPLNADWKK